MSAIFRRVAPCAIGAGAAAFQGFASSNTSTEDAKPPSKGSRLLFVGTGSSTGCPKPLCSMLFGSSTPAAETPELQQLRQDYQKRCRTSSLAARGDPKHNKDYRNNPALLITHCKKDNDSDCQRFIIDAGKTFREGALRWFPEDQVTGLDAIILTHHHMDAAGGLDDVRGFQKMAQRGTYYKAPQMVPMPLHLSEFCLSDVAERFPWLFPQQQPSYRTGTETDKPAVERHVASFDVQIFESFKPMNVAGLPVIPLPVWHGHDLISYGFAFTLHNKNDKPTHIVYISDISQMVPETMDYIMKKLPPTDILIVDALLPEIPHSVHFSLKQAVELSQQINAQQTYVVGMNCDAFATHDETNENLQKEYGGKVLLAYDGQVIHV